MKILRSINLALVAILLTTTSSALACGGAVRVVIANRHALANSIRARTRPLPNKDRQLLRTPLSRGA